MVCDFRYVNTAMKPKAGVMTEMWTMVREAAAALGMAEARDGRGLHDQVALGREPPIRHRSDV